MTEQEKTALVSEITAAVAALKTARHAMLPGIWERLLSCSAAGDGYGLLAPTSYILRVGGARFLVDPCLWPYQPDGGRDRPGDTLDPARVLAGLGELDGVILTHAHADHYDEAFVRMAVSADVTWYLPDFLCEKALAATGLPTERVVRTHPGLSVEVREAKLSFFESNHCDEDGVKCVPEYGFYLEHVGRQYVFPGDVRTYDPAFYAPLLDRLSRVEILFGHLWLGRGAALEEDLEPLLSRFCRFLAAFSPRQITLAHLYEVSRKPTDLWRYCRAGAVMDRLAVLAPAATVTPLQMGLWQPLK